MTDLATWKLRGGVRTLRSEIAEWNSAREEWQPARSVKSVTFDAAGRMTNLDQPGEKGSVYRSTCIYDDKGRIAEVRSGTAGGPVHTMLYSYDHADRLERVADVADDGTERVVETCRYDAAGRKVKVTSLPARKPGIDLSYGVEGSDIGYPAPGAVTVTTTYDERDQPIEAVFHDASHALVLRVVLTRDRAGRPLREEARLEDAAPLNLQGALGQLSPEDRAGLVAMYASAFGSIVTTFAYDSEGRLVERNRRMGSLDEERTTFTYDDHDNPTEERTESRSREMHVDETGALRASQDTVTTSQIRFAYTYDAEGNWTERVVWTRQQPDAKFVRSNIERRTVTY